MPWVMGWAEAHVGRGRSGTSPGPVAAQAAVTGRGVGCPEVCPSAPVKL